MSGEPAFYFAEDLIQRLGQEAAAARDMILGGRLGLEDYRAQSARYRAYQECMEIIHEMLRERQDEPLAAAVQRAERVRQ